LSRDAERPFAKGGLAAANTQSTLQNVHRDAQISRSKTLHFHDEKWLYRLIGVIRSSVF
jgi:hypothetical protein